MYLLQVLLCRDAYSYEPLKSENSAVCETPAEAARLFERWKRDYQAYVERREDTASMTRIELYAKNPQTRNWEFNQEWEFRLPLKKLVVVNPELKAYREKNAAKTSSKGPVFKPLPQDVIAQAQAMFQQVALEQEVVGPAFPEVGF